MSDSSGAGSILSTKYGGVSGKWWIVGGVGTAAAGYLWYRHSSGSSASSTAASGSTTPDPNAIDPATGETYAMEEQAATDAAQAYGTSGYDSSGFGTTGSSYEDTLLEGILADEQNLLSGEHHTPVAHPSDKSWATQTVDDLVKHGYSRTAAMIAIGAYLAGLPMTEQQEAIVEAGLALNGQPPTAPPKAHVTKPAPTQHKPRNPRPPRKPHKPHGVSTRGK